VEAQARAVNDRKQYGGSETVRTWDQGFVGAAPERVFEVLRDPAGYPAWWPGARRLGDGRLRLPGMPPATVAVDRVRPGVGLFVRLSRAAGPGGREGHLEWYLEPFEEGTMVNGITDLGAGRRWPSRRVLRVRSGVRSAMVALKEMLE